MAAKKSFLGKLKSRLTKAKTRLKKGVRRAKAATKNTTKKRNPSFEEIYSHCQSCDEYKTPSQLFKYGNQKVCKNCKVKLEKEKAKKAQRSLFEEQKTLFNPSRRKKNIEMGFHSGGQFHPIRASVDYNEFRAGDFDTKEQRAVRQKQNKKTAFYNEIAQKQNREERLKKKHGTKGLAKHQRLDSSGKSLSQFVRSYGGIKVSDSSDVKGELKRLSSRESRTTGLINKKSGRKLDHVYEAAIEAGYRNKQGDIWHTTGDFLADIERDATSKRAKLYANPKCKKNVEMGFRDSTGFHPIRASVDYDDIRAGEKSKGVSTRLLSAVAASKKWGKKRQVKSVGFAMNPTPKSVKKIRNEFAGTSQGKSREFLTPKDNIPKDVSELGPLVEIKVVGVKKLLKFSNNPAMLGAYSNGGRRRLVIGLKKNYAVTNPQSDVEIGEVAHVVYKCAKPHLGYKKVVPFVHKMGEEGGKPPVLIMTQDGLLKLKGGDYTIRQEGIRN